MKFKEYGILAKEARLKLGLTQKELSEKFGWTSPQACSNFERGLGFYPAYCLAVFDKKMARKLSDCEIRMQIKRFKEKKGLK
jgi:transcriptional regulator with XRE-family HTH domain